MPLSPRLKWKINRYGQRMEERLEAARNIFKSVMNKQRTCPACRALIDRKERVCPLCGEALAARSQGNFGGFLDAILPQQAHVTTLLLTANVFLFALTLIASSRARGGAFDFNTLLGSIDAYTMVRFGAKYGILISAGEWWRFLTPVFLHANLLHIGMNSWVLFDLGPAVETLYGRQKFVVLYILTGAVGFLLSFFWYPMSLSVGASGAIFGLIGAMIAYGYRHRTTASEAVRTMFMRWAFYGLLYGILLPGMDNAAHIGGLVGGLIFGSLVSDMPSVTQESIYVWKILQTIAVLLVVFGFVMVALRAPA